MSDKLKRFSLSRVLANAESRNAPEFAEIFELEKAEEAPMRDAGLFASSNKGSSFKVPFARMCYRDLEATTGSAANLANGTQIPFIQESLRPTALSAKLPITWLEGLKANLVLPRLSTGITGATGLAGTEIAAIASTDPVFGANSSTSPSRCSAQVVFSKQLLAQAAGSESLDKFLSQELLRAVSYEIDSYTLVGSGSAGQPNGLLTLGASLTANTWGAAVTWPNTLAAQKTMEAYFDAQDLTWLIGPGTAAKLRQTPRGTGNTAFHILEDSKIGDIACAVSPFVGTAEQTCLAFFPDLVLGFYGNGFDVTVDRFSKAKSGEIVITTTVFYGIYPRRVESFLISTDGGNQ